jgi:type VI secretion system protein ImpH
MTPLDALAARPWDFDFHQAMRRIDCAFRDLPRAGEAHTPEQEPVRLGQDPSLEFSPAALRQFSPPEAGTRGKLRVGFLGLFGPHSPLPLHFTELAQSRQRGSGDRTLGAFVDLFHHRALLLLHRSWTMSQPTARQDRPEEDGFGAYLSALSGQVGPSDGGPCQRLRWSFAAHFMQPTRNADGLEALLGEYFACAVHVREYLPEWLDIPESQAWRLGRSREQSTLGESTVAGRRVFQPSQKFRIELGPLSHADFERLLPGTSGFGELERLVSAYVGTELAWDVLLRLASAERPRLRLGQSGRLGRDAWLQPAEGQAESSRRPLGSNRAQDLLIDPRAVAANAVAAPTAAEAPQKIGLAA